MAKRKRKAISFDAMVKFFLQQYDIPTKKDVAKLVERMDRLEKLIRASTIGGKGGAVSTGKPKISGSAVKSIDIVFDVICKFHEGIDFEGIKAATGFDDKKIRNIIFRLHKLNKISRKRRGIYIAC
ncbi:MAG: hypothetical protein JRJ39_12165 [Deltaproteobacteria bacterium]|nr:hypothetical protein [Deltaproteobacteria bacterium]MBW1849007.1 hypothetical protein [Deltaproteobacteria bacterium]MBW2180329.1 hypothetical protein [Deltaproteobacteria bacterium]